VRFETLVAGEARQVDGPFYGVKVLSADPTQGATLTVTDIVWSLAVLPSLAQTVDRLIAKGPLVLVLAEDSDDDLKAMSAAPQPAAVTRTVYDSGAVAGGAAINSPVLDTSRLGAITIRADNLAGAANRTLSVNLLEEDGVTVVEPLSQVVNLGTRGLFAIGPAVGAAGITAAWSVLVSPRLSLSLALGGAQVGRLIVVGRP